MPDTDLVLMVNKLQALHRTLADIKYAPELSKYPTQLNTPSLPAVLTWVGPGRYSTKGGGWRWDVRTALILLYIEPLAQNDIPSNALKSITTLAALRELYINIANIPLANESGYQLTIESSPEMTHTDNGIEPNLSFGGAAFYGARLRVNVTLQWL